MVPVLAFNVPSPAKQMWLLMKMWAECHRRNDAGAHLQLLTAGLEVCSRHLLTVEIGASDVHTNQRRAMLRIVSIFL